MFLRWYLYIWCYFALSFGIIYVKIGIWKQWCGRGLGRVTLRLKGSSNKLEQFDLEISAQEGDFNGLATS